MNTLILVSIFRFFIFIFLSSSLFAKEYFCPSGKSKDKIIMKADDTLVFNTNPEHSERQMIKFLCFLFSSPNLSTSVQGPVPTNPRSPTKFPKIGKKGQGTQRLTAIPTAHSNIVDFSFSSQTFDHKCPLSQVQMQAPCTSDL